MSTTVPQNIKGSKIAGRHTPTRNSLRHSRMLVVNNKTQQGVQHPNPMNFKFPNLVRWLLILEILIGLFVTFLSIWVFFLTPNTAIQDNPYWSGLALLLAGILGLVLVRYKRIKRNKLRENCFIFLRADLYILSLLAVLLCILAVICASMHYARLTASDTKCEATLILQEEGSCTCTFHADDEALSAVNAVSNNESAVPETVENRSYKVEYRELSCDEVKGKWTTILGLSIAANTLGFIIALALILLLACYRHNSKRIYASVHTSTF
ncbi:sarcospan-like isoform X1 [Teleopsis dalmanni]|uniref:sarcospan-like isoform X1 n=1 Tax=Teleopsis dalmanni TaxID=139649 RepID=UPI0018CE8F36|nr:sarcospan-like isoform X1 [Teleopsis dalmanni]